jgi:hypothetical protein
MTDNVPLIALFGHKKALKIPVRRGRYIWNDD